jgi:phosphoribosyl 1,2-cyclic phosphodiesterase
MYDTEKSLTNLTRRYYSLTTMQMPVLDSTTSGTAIYIWQFNDRSLTMNSRFGQVQDHIPVYTSPETYDSIAKMFPYMVDRMKATGGGAVPSFKWNTFDTSNPFNIPSCGGISVLPLPVEHGVYFNEGNHVPYMCMGFRIGEVSYISDASKISNETKQKVEGSRVLILDALRDKRHPSHFSFAEVNPW